MILKSLLSINYIFWLILSVVFFAFGEFLSKKFASEPKIFYFVMLLVFTCLGMIFWLPAIMQKNQLSTVGVMWSVLSLLTTILIGILIFHEKLNLIGILGIIFAFISVILLSLV